LAKALLVVSKHILFYEDYADEIKKVADDLGLTAIEPGAYTVVKMANKIDGKHEPAMSRRPQPDSGNALTTIIVGHPFIRMYLLENQPAAAALFFQGVRFSETFRTSQVLVFTAAVGGYEIETLNSVYRMFRIDPMGRFGKYLNDLD